MEPELSTSEASTGLEWETDPKYSWLIEGLGPLCEFGTRAVREKEWLKLIFYHQREDRWRVLRDIAHRVWATDDMPEVFREVWMDSESIWGNRRIISKLLRFVEISPRGVRRLYSKDDWKKFRALPDRFKIYRGAKFWNKCGMSWTTDIERAVYFATHHHHTGMACGLSPDQVGFVMEKTIAKSSILFFTDERNESEVILRRSTCGRISAEGMLQVAESTCVPERYAAELEKHRERLSPEVIAHAEKMLWLMGWRKE
jgi:hypothetical protein